MIKVYNKSTNYLLISGKKVAPFKSEEFESRNSQIRVLERNGSISVSEILSENIIPQTTLTSNPEVKEEKAEVIKMEEPVAEVKVVEEPVVKKATKKSTSKKGGKK